MNLSINCCEYPGLLLSDTIGSSNIVKCRIFVMFCKFFSCEDAAQQVLMSVCPSVCMSVVKLKITFHSLPLGVSKVPKVPLRFPVTSLQYFHTFYIGKLETKDTH